MTEYAFITELPCSSCDNRRTVHAEPPYDVCWRSRFADPEPLDEMTAEDCTMLAAAQYLSDIAVAVAGAKFRHTPRGERERIIGSIADALSDLATDIGAEFDAGAWVEMCGAVKVGVAA